jgi:hypothetical protein
MISVIQKFLKHQQQIYLLIVISCANFCITTYISAADVLKTFE